jgi:signal transduction histidine kinase
MFNKLRMNMAIRNSVTLGTAFIAILVLIFLANLFKTSDSIEKSLANVSQSRIYNPVYDRFSLTGEQPYPELNKHSISVFLQKDGKYIVTNSDFYDQDTLNKLLGAIPQLAKRVEPTGRIQINGNYMAYNVSQDKFTESYTAYIYDYTKENSGLFELAITIFVLGSIGLIGIVYMSYKMAEKSVEPVENSFHKQIELVGNAGHELKTPLTIISTNLSILNENIEEIPKDNRKWIESIGTQVSRLNNLVVEMLELAKMDEMRTSPIKNQISLSDIAERVALETEVLAFENDINIVTNISPDIKIMGIEHNIEKLIYILVDNAIKYTNSGGTVTLSVEYEKKKPILKVINTGDGIAKEDIDKLFDRFFRVNKAHNIQDQEAKSFGLGLSIAKSIIDGHQATVCVDSEKGKFTEFCVTFKN